jgi:signal transduction histidine kinase/ActR/RegA family two-component response regulator
MEKASLLNWKTLLVTLGVIATFVFSAWLGWDRLQKEQVALQEWEERSRLDATRGLALAATTMVWDMNEVALNEALRAYGNMPDVLAIRVFQGPPERRQLFAGVADPGFQWDAPPPNAMLMQENLVRGGRLLGFLEVAYEGVTTDSLIHEQFHRLLLQNGAFALVVVFLLTLLGVQRHSKMVLKGKGRELEKINLELQEEIAERIALEGRLRSSRDEARRANEVKQEFLANISHELRTPLNGVIGATTVLTDEKAEKEQAREALGVLRASSESLLEHLDDVLTFTALDGGRFQPVEEEFSLSSVLQPLARRAEADASHKGLTFTFARLTALPDRVRGSGRELRRCLWALLDNAIKFTSQGKVECTVAWNANHLEAVVKDTGPGIPEQHRSRIFEAFFQADSSASRRHGGLGLGLSLTKRVVESMGGELRCLSDHGTTMTLILPLHPMRPEETTHQNWLTSVPAEPHKIRRFNILVVEDNHLNRKILVLLLRKRGFDAITVDSGAEALERLAQTDFDLVLMDVQMPDMDGLEVTRRIRAQFAPAQQPFIIALTAHSLPQDRETCLAAGMDAYLSKPVEAEVLVEWIDKLRALPKEERRQVVLAPAENDSAPPAGA